MSNTIFLFLFTLLLILSTVYCIIKKKYLHIFFPCLLFLPSYYGLEFSAALPILSATRIMYIILFIYALVNKRKSIKIKNISWHTLPKEYLFLTGYFALRIISNMHYAHLYNSSNKTILMIIFEQLFLILAIYLLAPTHDELYSIVKVIVWVATALFIIGILESIFSYRPFDALYTISRDIYNLQYYRLGLLRATTTMFAPAVYGNMCILVMPFILFLYEQERSKKYLAIAGLDILATIHSGSRAAMFFLLIVIGVYFLFILTDKNRHLLFIKNIFIIIGFLFLYLCIACICSPSLKYFYVGNVKSVLNEVGFEFDLNEGAPSGVDGFGGNNYGSSSRIRQFTGIYYVAQRNFLFGMGADAPSRQEIQYYWRTDHNKNTWVTTTGYDVGIVEIFCDEGLIGILGMCSLLVFLFLKSSDFKFGKYILFCYLISTLATGNLFAFLMLYLILISNHKAPSK